MELMGRYAAANHQLIHAHIAKALGVDWERFARATSNVPFVAIAQGRNRFDFGEIGIRKVAIGLALYLAFLLLHPWLFGARPY